MNYSIHYERLISRARGRVLVGYSERHHIVPRCLGGCDVAENIVRLTGREHYVAHQLLVKIHPGNCKLVYSVRMMTVHRKNSGRSNNNLYGWLRERWAVAHGNFIRGKPQSKETIEKRSAVQRGKKQTREHIENSRRARTGMKRSAEHCAKMSMLLKGRKFSSEWIEKLRTASTGRKHSEEHKVRMSNIMTGKRNALGFRHTEDAKARISNARRGVRRKPFSIEWREKIRHSMIGNQNLLGHVHSRETREKIRESNFRRQRAMISHVFCL